MATLKKLQSDEEKTIKELDELFDSLNIKTQKEIWLLINELLDINIEIEKYCNL